VHQQLSQKANLIDMKKTMAEVAAHIESRVSFEDAKRMLEDKVSRADFHFQIQNKPSFDDIKTMMDQMAVSPQQEMFEDELTKMRTRIEELYKEVSRKANSTGAGSKEVQALTTTVEQRLAELEEKLDEKANKQSVA
jgi:soluble cytochrome b562